MTSMSAYDKLETAFIEGKTKDIAKVMQEFRNDFIADRNLGLVKQVLDAHFNHSILKVKSAYSKISISKICLLLGKLLIHKRLSLANDFKYILIFRFI